jgi:uncharacterized protein YlxP (DUF503 family)
MVGFYQLELYIPSALSLKEKRFVLKSIKERIRNKFNVSIAELGENEKWQRSLLGIAMVSNDGQLIESSFNKILNLIDNDGRVEVIDRLIEYY